MSTTIDQKVVEMRFDNKHFEQHTRESMSTLDKLKQKLNLTGASKGLENINTAANKVNMSGMSNAIETVHSKFSALEVMGITALANITNSAVNAGKRIASALTIDPIKTGLQEYETQINSVQTILANTQKEGTDIKKVNAALDELNAYADKTIYNFTEMTRNIGTFTAAGVKLDTSVSAIKGISNLAAVSGSTSQQASTAMYQLSQALASGTVKLMDWNSVVNAGMGGQVFQDALKETARVHGVAIDKMIKEEGSFRDTLSKGWLSSEILTETLEKFTYASEEMTEAEKERVTTMLKSKGYTDKQIEGIFKLGNTATEAATKVKTFSQLWDVLKETAQSGWAQTWRLLIGDFEEAKSLFTPLANFLTGIIDGFSKARNKLLEGALGKSFTGLLDKIKSSADGVKKVVDTVKDYGKVVDEIINGKWGNGQTRWDKLAKSGYDWAHAQNLVNEKLGNGYRHATKYKEAQNGVKDSQEKVTESTTDYIVGLMKLTEAELKAKGYTDEQIQAFKDLAEAADKTGIPIKEFIENIDEIDGRYLLINSFKNIGHSIVSIFTALGKAWRDVFPPMQSEQLFNIIAGFHKLSTRLKMSDETAENLRRTLRGVFAVLDLVLTIVGGPIKIALKILGQLLGAFDLNILDITAKIGDTIYQFNQWLKSTLDLTEVFEFLVPYLKAASTVIKEWFKQLGESKVVKKFTEYLNKAKESVGDWFKGLKDVSLEDIISFFKNLGNTIKKVFSNINKHFNGVPGDILSGLANGLKNGATTVINAIYNLATSLVAKFKEILGIHSPSTVFFAIGGFIIAGLIGGLLSGSTDLGSTVGSIVDKIKEFFGNIDWSTIFSAGMSVGMLMVIKNISDTVSNFSKFFGGLGGIFSSIENVIDKSLENIAKVVKSFSKILNGIAFKYQTEGIKNLAISILILVGAIAILTQLGKTDIKAMWNAVGIIAALAVILGVLSFAMNQMNKASLSISKEGVKANGTKSAMLSIGIALLAMGAIVKMLGTMSPEQMKQGFLGLAGAVLALVTLFAAYGLLIKGKAAQNIDKAGKMIRKMAISLLLMAAVVKIVSKFGPDELKNGVIFVGGFLVFVALLSTIALIPGKNLNKLGGTLIKISIAMLLMAAVVKKVSKFGPNELKNGLIFAGSFLAFIAILLAATMIPGGKVEKLGGILISISAAMLLMVGVVKLISGMEWAALGKGAAGILGLGLIIAGLMYMVKVVGPDAPKLAATIIAMATAIGILAGVAIVLSLISIPGLAKGIIAVGMLGGVMSLMIKATKDANDVKGSIIAMAVAIGIMAAAVALLSFIDWTKLLPATLALSALMGMFSLIEKQSKNVTGSMGCLIVMVLAIGMLTTALYIVSKLPVENTIGAAISLSILMGVLAGVLTVLSKLRTTIKDVLPATVGLLALCVPLVAIAGVLLLLKDVSNSMSSVIALTTMLTAMTVIISILSKIGPMATAALPGMGVLAVFVAGLIALIAVIGAIVKYVPVVKDFINEGLDLLIRLASGIGEMIGAFVKGVLTKIASGLPEIGTMLSEFMNNAKDFIDGSKQIDSKVLAGIGILAGAIIALTAANVIEGVMSFMSGGSSFAKLGTELSNFMKNADTFLTSAKKIDPETAQGIRTIAEVILILTAADVLKGLTSWFTGDNSISKFGNELPKLGEGLKGFSDAVEGINSQNIIAASNAAKSLAEMASVIPNEGGVIGWFAGENSISKFGNELIDLGKGLKGFSNETQGIIPDNIIAASNAAKALAEMASTVPNQGGVVSWFTGDNSIAKFGDELVQLGKGLKGFSNEVQGINPENVTAASNAAKALAEMASTVPNEGGVVSWFTGDNSISKFGGELINLGSGLKGFSDKIQGINPENVTAAAAAAKSLALLTLVAPSENGMLSWFAGDKSLSKYSNEISNLGFGLKGFSDSVTGINLENITAATNAAKLVAMMTQIAPVEGGVEGWFAGEKSIAKYGSEIGSLGWGLKNFSDQVTGINLENITAAINAAKLIAMLTQMAPNEGGVVGFFGGEKSLANYGAQMGSLGWGLKNFSDQTEGISAENIVVALDAAQAIAILCNEIPKFDPWIFGEFMDGLPTFGSKLKAYYSNVSGITAENISTSIKVIQSIKEIESISSINSGNISSLADSITKIIDSVKNMASVTSASADNFNNALKTLSENGAKNFLKGFDNLKNDMKTIAENATDGFAGGIENKQSSATSACTNLVTECANTIKDKADKFKTAGKNLVQGFADGIDQNTYLATAKAKAMANAAEAAAREALDINSPSKVFRKIGSGIPEGFAQGITMFGSSIKRSVNDMSDTTITSTQNIMSRILDTINMDMDTQPTIRPVLDLSDVESGAGYISSMFNDGPSFGVMSNLRAISSGMDERIQNGTNNDIISAIDKLGKNLGNVGGNTYNVNGVTYDDGSNISEAVKALIRAARVERRM